MIDRTIARLLLHEHRHRPIVGNVLCLGPQVVLMPRAEIDKLFAELAGSTPEARSAPRGPGVDTEHLSDVEFFNRFPIDRLDSLDVVEGFGGTVIHDLNTPVPDALHGRFDFILDGGTFDHLVQLGTALDNVASMLKPGGRVLHYNAASGYLGACYVAFGPAFFYDYYVLNRFADCQIYIARMTGKRANDPWDVFHVPYARTKQLNASRSQMVVCIAEKGAEPSRNRVPVQYAYRNAEMQAEFGELERRLGESRPRAPLSGGRPPFVAVREAMKRWRLEFRWARDRHRAGKFSWRMLRNRRARLKATGYVYVGRI